jgi:hypothetical protein
VLMKYVVNEEERVKGDKNSLTNPNERPDIL